jgi:hypothetical protein
MWQKVQRVQKGMHDSTHSGWSHSRPLASPPLVVADPLPAGDFAPHAVVGGGPAGPTPVKDTHFRSPLRDRSFVNVQPSLSAILHGAP